MRASHQGVCGVSNSRDAVMCCGEEGICPRRQWHMLYSRIASVFTGGSQEAQQATMTLACMSAVMPAAILSLPAMLLPTSSAGLLGATSAITILVTPSSKISPKRRLACASFVSNVNLQRPRQLTVCHSQCQMRARCISDANICAPRSSKRCQAAAGDSIQSARLEWLTTTCARKLTACPGSSSQP